MKAKSWNEKLRCDMQPEVKPLGKAFGGFPAGARLLIPTPMMVMGYVNSIPLGESRTAQQMRADLAAQNDADTTCPLCSGIFLRIVAEAAHETGADVPVWRIIDAKSPTRKKLSFDVGLLDKRRAAEGLPA
ncbi:MAG: hypothetical protein WCK51_14810 [Armatimonadota bacterium]